MKIISNLIVALLVTTVGTVSRAEGQTQQPPAVVQLQERILNDGAQQAIQAVAFAKQICEAAGGTYDPSRVRPEVHSKTSSRVESRARQRNGRYGGGRNVIHLDLNRVMFGQPALPQDYRNEVSVEVDASNACKDAK